ncbi:hypothetical protein MMC25_002127 [Agyrium rufum]|nr:hypothetical protein [Agyrium rufum]
MAEHQESSETALEAITAFQEFGSSFLSVAVEVSSSSTPINIPVELANAQSHLKGLFKRLRVPLKTHPTCLTEDEQVLENALKSCIIVGDDLTLRFARYDEENKNATTTDWTSKAIFDSIWTKADLSDLNVSIARLYTIALTHTHTLCPSAVDQRDKGPLIGAHSKDSLKQSNDNEPNRDVLQPPKIRNDDVLLQKSESRQKPTMANSKNLMFSTVSDPSPKVSGQAKPDYSKEVHGERVTLIEDFILEGLSFASMKDREEEVTKAHKKTFEWIFDEQADETTDQEQTYDSRLFLDWLRGPDEEPVFWVNGKAGSGKSTLMRFIHGHEETLHQLQRWSGQTPLYRAAFFFWASGSAEQRSQVGLLRYLLLQLLEQRRELIPIVFEDLWARCWTASTVERIKMVLAWESQDLIKSLRTFFHSIQGQSKVCLFVDGLDELDGDHQGTIELFRSLTASRPSDVKICISSRPWLVFEESFSQVPTFKLQDLTLTDMQQYIRDAIKSNQITHSLSQDQPKESSAFPLEVVERANGVFLWVTLVMKSILARSQFGDDMAALRDRLQAYPSDIDDLFDHLLFQMQPLASVKEASRVFQLIRAREEVCNFTGDHSAASSTLWDLTLALNGSNESVLNMAVEDMPQEDVLEHCKEVRVRVDDKCAGMLEVHIKACGERLTSAKFSGEMRPNDLRRLVRSKVTYCHRTVRDYVHNSRVWNRILQYTVGSNFEPHICHVRSYVLQLKRPLEETERHRRLDEWWPDIAATMTHARYCGWVLQGPLYDLLNELNRTLSWYWLSRKNDPLDHWARNAFGSYEGRKNLEYHDPFLSLATRFGVAAYIGACFQLGDIVYKGGQPLLSYASEFLVGQRKTIYPLSSPELIDLILENGGDPDVSYVFSGKHEETPWLSALKLARQAHRLGWFKYYDDNENGTIRVARIVNIFLSRGADPNALILADRWDPTASALDILNMVLEKFGSKCIREARDLLIRLGAKSSAELLRT